MSGNVNPNSRASFVDKDGKLTKYGMETIKKLNDALEISGDSNAIDEILADTASNNFGKYKSLERRIAALEESAGQILKYKSILKRLDDIESQL